MARLSSAGKPSFFWQGLLVLLPVFMLALLGVIFLQKDKAAVEDEARKNAAALAPHIADYVGKVLFRQMEEQYLDALQVSDTNPPPGTRIQTALDTDGPFWDVPMRPYRRLLASLPPFRVAQARSDGVFPAFIASESGQLITPAPYPDNPAPEPLDVSTLSDHQLELWRNARRAEGADAIALWREFLSSSPPRRLTALANVELAHESVVSGDHASVEALTGTIAFNRTPCATESGLPLQPLASLERLRAVSGNPKSLTSAANSLASNAVAWPSIISASLLDEAVRLSPDKRSEGSWAANTYPANPIAWRDSWLVEEQARDLHGRLAGAGLLPNLFRRPVVFWTNWQNQPWLVIPSLLPATNGTAPRLAVQAAPETLLDTCLWEALDRSKIPVPSYMGVSFEVLGRNFTNAPSGPVLAEARTDWPWSTTVKAHRGYVGSVTVPGLVVRLLMSNPAGLFALQRQRQFMYGSLIAAALFAAFIGFLAARRAFHRQLRLNDLKSDFVSSVSHELRAPIASVRLLAEGLEAGRISEPGRQREYFKFIVQECRRLSSLIENVLDFSRIEQGRKQYDLEPTDLVALTRQTVALMETYAAERRIRLTFRQTGDAAPADLDGKAIQQALVNLIDNAIKHSPNGSEIAVSLDFQNGSAPTPTRLIHLSVEDHGEGIPASEHEKIFERFYRVGSELRRKTQGVGIGLSIVKHIVEAHGGRVTVRSAPGEGSRFTIELPTGKELT